MGKEKFDVFISYRRNGGVATAKLIYDLLKEEYDVFYDHAELRTGDYKKKIKSYIENATDVLFVLTDGCFDGCVEVVDQNEEEVFFLNEIKWAIDSLNKSVAEAEERGEEPNKSIILLRINDFSFPRGKEKLQYHKAVQELIKENAFDVNIAHVEHHVDKIKELLKSPRKEKVSPVDSVREWEEFARCLTMPKYTKIVPKELREKILRGAISSFLDEWNAKIFTSILDKMSGQVYNIRTKFRYEIEIREGFNFREIEIDEDKYYELSETLSYTKKFLKGAPDKTFWLSFVTNLDELDSALRDENFFFSENLLMDREDIKILSKLSNEDKEEFYLSVMRVRINVNGKVYDPVEILIDESGVFGKYEITEEDIFSSETLDVKIRFRIPQRDKDGYFFASISEPTFSPLIQFIYPEDAYDVTMIPFINRSVTAKEAKIFEGVRELSVENEWVIPVGGAIFLIEKHEKKNKKALAL